MAQLSLFLVVDSKTAVVSDTDPTSYAFPPLCQGDTTAVEITLLKRVSQVAAPFFSKLQASLYSVRLGLFKRDGTTLAYIAAGSFVRNDVSQSFTAIFPLNTAAIDTLVTAAAGSDISNTVLQVELTEIATGGVTTIYTNKQVSLEKDYLTNATQAVAAGEVAATIAQVQAGFVPIYETVPVVRIRQSLGGVFFRTWLNDDGIEQSELYVPPA